MVTERVDSFLARLDRELADAGKDKQAGEVWNWRGVPRIGPDALPTIGGETNMIGDLEHLVTAQMRNDVLERLAAADRRQLILVTN